jgi:hypothetical protein
MAIVALPAAFKVKEVTWSAAEPAAVNRSAYTNKRTAVVDLWSTMREAKVQIVPVAEADALAIIAFFEDLKGPINSFRLRATRSLQLGLVAAAAMTSVSGAAGATSLTVGPGTLTPGLVLPRGTRLTLNDQLLVVAADFTVPSVSASLSVTRPLRAATSSDSIVAGAPTCLVSLKEGVKPSFAVSESGIHYWDSFEVEEAF